MSGTVVTGLGLVTPLGTGVEPTWEGVRSGVSSAAHITRFDADDYSRIPDVACEVDSDPSEWPETDTQKMGRYAQFAVKAAAEALDHAGFDPDDPSYDSAAVGTSIASAMGGLPEFEGYSRSVADDEWITPRAMLTFLPSLASSYASIEFDARGPNRASSAACAAGGQSIADAIVDIEAGRADVMLAGAAEGIISPTPLAGFSALRGMTTSTDDPASACRPFDADRDGTVLGEGAAVLVIEDDEHARDRGATPLATISGFGLSADASHPAKPIESAAGLVAALQSAFDDADTSPSETDYVSAHATGTPAGDEHEATGLDEFFAECPPVTSVKPATGHTLGASGAVEAALAVQSIRESEVPPTVNCDRRDEACDVPVVTAPREEDVTVVASNSLGFGGTNCTLVIEDV
jgi:3-oxoacyl-[acyl-carrier-protein] synthase II